MRELGRRLVGALDVAGVLVAGIDGVRAEILLVGLMLRGRSEAWCAPNSSRINGTRARAA